MVQCGGAGAGGSSVSQVCRALLLCVEPSLLCARSNTALWDSASPQRGYTEKEQLTDWHSDHPLASRRPSLECAEAGCPPSLLALLQSGWADEPAQRPRFGAFVKDLEQIEAATPAPSVACAPADAAGSPALRCALAALLSDPEAARTLVCEHGFGLQDLARVHEAPLRDLVVHKAAGIDNPERAHGAL